MIKEVRIKKNFLISIGLASIIIFSFQNCGQQMTTVGSNSALSSNATGSVSLTPCVAAGCVQDASYIQVAITNNNPITFLSSQATMTSPSVPIEQAVDVAGYCNSGGYPSSRIYYSIQDLAGNIVVSQTASNGICNHLGRFQFSLNISMLSGASNYEVNVILKAVDSTGVEFDNSIGLNKRQVGLSPVNGM